MDHATDHAQVDHLVIAADTLERGVEWCEATLGVTPHAGGEHPLMGTHNRLLRIASPGYAHAYLEIISVNEAAPAPQRRRWFDLDDEVLRARVREEPRLVHFVARTADAARALAAWTSLGIDPGPAIAAQRDTPAGLLRWRITVRDDGRRLFDGALPTLIQWGGQHPSEHLPHSGLHLLSVELTHPQAHALRQALAAIGLDGVTVLEGVPNIVATLSTPGGIVQLASGGA